MQEKTNTLWNGTALEEFLIREAYRWGKPDAAMQDRIDRVMEWFRQYFKDSTPASIYLDAELLVANALLNDASRETDPYTLELLQKGGVYYFRQFFGREQAYDLQDRIDQQARSQYVNI